MSDYSAFEASRIEFLIKDLHERLTNLTMMNPVTEIHAFCDELTSQVVLTFDSVVKQLQEQQEKFLGEIQTYRESLLDSRSNRSLAQREKADNIQQDLLDTAAEITSFELEYSKQLSSVNENPEMTADFINTAAVRAEEQREKMRELRKRIREDTFGARFLKFEVDELAIKQKDLLGKFVFRERDEGNDDERVQSANITISEKPFATLHSHGKSVIACKYLSNGCLITSGADKTVRLWNRYNEPAQALVDGLSHTIIDILELPNGFFMSGSKGGELVLWNEAFKPIQRLSAHSRIFYSLKLLPNGNVASLSHDDTIKIWDGYLEGELNLLFTMKGHGCRQAFCRLTVLSNGFLLTCSDLGVEASIKIWDPYKGLLVREFQTAVEAEGVHSYTLLRNNDLAITTYNGSLFLINLDDTQKRKTLFGPRKGNCNTFILELPNGHILIENESKNHELEVWNPETGELVQSFVSGHQEIVYMFSLSADGKILVTGSIDGTVKLWNVIFFKH